MTPAEREQYRLASAKMIREGRVSVEVEIPRTSAHRRKTRRMMLRPPARQAPNVWPKFDVIGLPPSKIPPKDRLTS